MNNKEKKIDLGVMAGSAVGVVAGQLITDIITPTESVETSSETEIITAQTHDSNHETESQSPIMAEVVGAEPAIAPALTPEPIEVLANPTISIEGSEGANVVITNNINLNNVDMGDYTNTHVNGDVITADIDEHYIDDSDTVVAIDDSTYIASSLNTCDESVCNNLFDESDDYIDDSMDHDYMA